MVIRLWPWMTMSAPPPPRFRPRPPRLQEKGEAMAKFRADRAALAPGGGREGVAGRQICGAKAAKCAWNAQLLWLALGMQYTMYVCVCASVQETNTTFSFPVVVILLL